VPVSTTNLVTDLMLVLNCHAVIYYYTFLYDSGGMHAQEVNGRGLPARGSDVACCAAARIRSRIVMRSPAGLY
jgi:hypothetical protein